MKFCGQDLDGPEINLTPLIDVVFLLLIFFMVSSNFKSETELAINLADVKTNGTSQNTTFFVFEVDAHGNYALREYDETGLTQASQKINKSDIQKEMGRIASLVYQGTVTISADRKASHESVMTIIESANLAGIEKLNFRALSKQ